MRLTQVGAVVTGIAAVNYTVQSGAMGLIKHAHLYSAGTLIESVRDVHLLSSFNTMRKSNGACGSLSKFLARTAQGYEVVEDTGLIFETGFPRQVTNDASTTPYAWIDLRDIFGVLRSASFLNCEKMRNLRIVIEWRSDYQYIFGGDMTNLTACDIIQPELIVDQVTSEKTINAIKLFTGANKQVPFLSTEKDSINIKACADTVTETDQHTLNGYNGKFVERILMIPQENEAGIVQALANVTKLDRADVYKNEEWQLILNNNNMFDYKGVDSSARKLALLADTHGDLCMPFGSDRYAVLRSANLYPADSIPLQMIGKCGYFGAMLSTRVSKLQIKYQRTGFAAHPVFTLNVYGEVYKAIQYTDDGFNVVYL